MRFELDVVDMPVGKTFVEDGRLIVSKTPWSGVRVWSLESGELLLDDGRVPAAKYHRGAKQFWGFGEKRTHSLARLVP